MKLTKNNDIFNILIVDDTPPNLGVLSEILKNEGYRVRPVPSGKLALQAIEKEKPDLILLDIMMPEMDGFEVCQKLKADPNYNNIPIIFISALNETKDIVKALSFGGADYITKPFQAEEIKARVKTQLMIYEQNKELIELNAIKDKFFSIIAHDLRSPFGGFLGLTRILAEESSTMKREDIERLSIGLNTSAKNLFQLLTDLLEWAKMQQEIIQIIPEHISLSPIVQNEIKFIAEQAMNKNITITNNIPDEFEIYVDSNIIKTLVRNLLSNAVKFTKANGNIELSAKYYSDNGAEIVIKDTGIGMNEEMRTSLFRIDKNTGRKGTAGEQSSGLGLILCKDFIEKHGGTIWVESEENKGSTFHISLPSS